MKLGVLLKLQPGTPPPPENLPIGRAALQLRRRGVQTWFGERTHDGQLCGFEAIPGGWRPGRVGLDAALDRYGSFSDPISYQALLEGLGAIVLQNPPRLTALLRDKLATQICLSSFGMPELTTDPRIFELDLRRYRGAFLKPRYGSFGRGVEFVSDGPLHARRWIDGVDQPMVLQQAVRPPRGWAGISLRILAQRGPDGPIIRTPVARLSKTDPVVNRARGASVMPAEDLFPKTAEAARELAHNVLLALPDAIEIGVDAVVDPSGTPVLIEVNARPRGRLAALATADPHRFREEHEAAVLAPLEALLRT